MFLNIDVTSFLWKRKQKYIFGRKNKNILHIKDKPSENAFNAITEI